MTVNVQSKTNMYTFVKINVTIFNTKTLPAIGGHRENFLYTSSIFYVYVVVENVWTPLSASFSRLLQRLTRQLLPTSDRQVLGVIRAMDTIDFASVCFWWGQIAAEKYLCYTKCRCTVSL